ncbi:response regulator transcription factor [Lentibacter sp.]|uniref:response regulator transcription factor n=1 Tax=Lentibacter sp. TaxID=2024994 RepID=UPI003F6D0204
MILIADDHVLVSETIAAYLEQSGLQNIVTVQSLDEALAKAAASESLELVLLDWRMPGMEGLQGLSRMKDVVTDAPVAMMSGMASPEIAQEAISMGAAGFVPKTLGAKSLVSTIRLIMSGETYVPFEFMKDAGREAIPNLTRREAEVLRCVCAGKPNKQIARELELKEVTVKLHVKTMCRKLGAANRTQAAMIARDRQLV